MATINVHGRPKATVGYLPGCGSYTLDFGSEEDSLTIFYDSPAEIAAIRDRLSEWLEAIEAEDLEWERGERSEQYDHWLGGYPERVVPEREVA